MKQTTRIGIAVAGVLVVVAVIWFSRDLWQTQAPMAPHLRGKRPGPCPGKTLNAKMPDVYMRGIIEKGAEFQVIENWYSCNPVKRGDRVYFSPGSSFQPTVKIVEGAPGDRFEVVKDAHGGGWNLKINGDRVTRDGKPYAFGGDQPPPLALYEKQRKGILGPDELILFSAFPPGDLDSGILGIVNTEDLVGKVL